ncbi:hypothetical protein HMI51_42105, partial [Corallococcus coralloides]|nr:hypothetical protein [Corallococcus coralloides]
VVVVLGLLRNALGVQQVPPNMVLNGIAIIISVYVMSPVVMEASDRLQMLPPAAQSSSTQQLLAAAGAAREPFRAFLAKRYGSLQALNAQLGSAFTSFPEIQAPARDARSDAAIPVFQHYDASAAGSLAVSGWLWDPEGRIDGLDLYLDARYLGPI